MNLDDITPEDVGLNSEITEKVTHFVSVECKRELEGLEGLLSILESLPGNENGVPMDDMLRFVEGYACAVLYKYVSGRNPSENTIEKLYNSSIGDDNAS